MSFVIEEARARVPPCDPKSKYPQLKKRFGVSYCGARETNFDDLPEDVRLKIMSWSRHNHSMFSSSSQLWPTVSKNAKDATWRDVLPPQAVSQRERGDSSEQSHATLEKARDKFCFIQDPYPYPFTSDLDDPNLAEWYAKQEAFENSEEYNNCALVHLEKEIKYINLDSNVFEFFVKHMGAAGNMAEYVAVEMPDDPAFTVGLVNPADWLGEAERMMNTKKWKMWDLFYNLFNNKNRKIQRAFRQDIQHYGW
jgi:hypothetical protein